MLGLNIAIALLIAVTAGRFGHGLNQALTGACAGVKVGNNDCGSDFPGCNTLSHSFHLLMGNLGEDSWWPMQEAFNYWSKYPDDKPIYSALLIDGNTRFQYPPSTLLIPLLLVTFRANQEQFYFLMTYFCLASTAIATSAIALYSLREFGKTLLSRNEKLLFLVIISLLTLTYYPIVKASTLGQIQVWLTAAFAISLCCYLSGRHTLAGIMVGLMASVKPQYGIFILWGIIRRDKQFVLASLGTIGVSSIIGASVFGMSTYFDYLQGLGYLSRHGEAFYANQSVNGLANRIFSIYQPELYPNTGFGAFPPYNPWVYYPTIITGIVILVTCLLVGRNKQTYGRGADYCLMALGVTIASPIAWEHHYGILFPVFAFLWPLLWFGNTFAESHRSRLVFVICFLLSSNFISTINILAPTFLNFLQSYLLFAALGVFVLLLNVRRRCDVA